ncbi:hypothetical protein B0H17DRAFT_1230271 [Mycena rosella]|uniref:Uncharacterized protein n=1 Tax=Mycena rosella TaxID=1033263 RepID=A0AAD7D6P6_MYCRO|nr:hypothetical protein B0H17DRAFT_1230271 [Mycena rosella]
MPAAMRQAYATQGSIALPLEEHLSKTDWKTMSAKAFMKKYGDDVLALYNLPTEEEMANADADDEDEDDGDDEDGMDEDEDPYSMLLHPSPANSLHCHCSSTTSGPAPRCARATTSCCSGAESGPRPCLTRGACPDRRRTGTGWKKTMSGRRELHGHGTGSVAHAAGGSSEGTLIVLAHRAERGAARVRRVIAAHWLLRPGISETKQEQMGPRTGSSCRSMQRLARVVHALDSSRECTIYDHRVKPGPAPQSSGLLRRGPSDGGVTRGTYLLHLLSDPVARRTSACAAAQRTASARCRARSSQTLDSATSAARTSCSIGVVLSYADQDFSMKHGGRRTAGGRGGRSAGARGTGRHGPESGGAVRRRLPGWCAGGVSLRCSPTSRSRRTPLGGGGGSLTLSTPEVKYAYWSYCGCSSWYGGNGLHGVSGYTYRWGATHELSGGGGSASEYRWHAREWGGVWHRRVVVPEALVVEYARAAAVSVPCARTSRERARRTRISWCSDNAIEKLKMTTPKIAALAMKFMMLGRRSRHKASCRAWPLSFQVKRSPKSMSMRFALASSIMPEVMMGVMPSAMSVPRLDARMTRIQYSGSDESDDMIRRRNFWQYRKERPDERLRSRTGKKVSSNGGLSDGGHTAAQRREGLQ